MWVRRRTSRTVLAAEKGPHVWRLMHRSARSSSAVAGTGCRVCSPPSCVVPYLRDIARGTTRPQRVSWFVFAALSTVAAVAQFLDGDLAGAWLATGLGRRVRRRVRRVDPAWRGRAPRSPTGWPWRVGVLGVVVSVVVEQPMVALFAVIVAEVLAIAITVRKAQAEPSSETLSTWCIDGLAGLVAIAAVPTAVVVGAAVSGAPRAGQRMGGGGDRARPTCGRSAQADGVGAPERVGVHERAGDRRLVGAAAGTP